MARVIVDVMLKPEILDPQGRAVMGALGRLGMADVSSVRQGKRFELEIDAEVDEDLSERLHEIAASLLSNPVIEDYEIYEEGDEVGCDCDDCAAEPDETIATTGDDGSCGGDCACQPSAATSSDPVQVGRPAPEQT